MSAISLAIAMICIKTFGQADARERDENFDGVPVLENIWKPDHILESLNLSSKLACGVKCIDLLDHGPCQSFGWNTLKRQCVLYTKPYYSAPTSGVTEHGWQHFNVKACFATVENGALNYDKVFALGTTLTGQCNAGYGSPTGGITAYCEEGYQVTISGTCKKLMTSVAVGKPARESTTAVPNNPPGVAVDGNRDTNWFSGSCTHTYFNDFSPWWRVDLLAIYHIITVRMVNRGDPPGSTDVSDRLRDATITAGNTTSTITTYCGFFAGPGRSGQLVTVNCVPGVIGRHVKIQIQTEFLTLCEVDVFVIPL